MVASAAMASASSSLPPAGQPTELSFSNGEENEDIGRGTSYSDVSGCSDGSGYGSRERAKTTHKQEEEESAYGEIGDVGETFPKVDAAAARAISRMQSQSSSTSSSGGGSSVGGGREDTEKDARSQSGSSKSSVSSGRRANLATSDARRAGTGLGAGLTAAKRLSRTKSMTNYSGGHVLDGQTVPDSHGGGDGVDGQVRPPVPAARMRARSMDGESLLAHTHTGTDGSEGAHRGGEGGEGRCIHGTSQQSESAIGDGHEAKETTANGTLPLPPPPPPRSASTRRGAAGDGAGGGASGVDGKSAAVAKPTVQSRTKSALRRLGGSQKRRLVTSQPSWPKIRSILCWLWC
jgi:hypothetical protein